TRERYAYCTGRRDRHPVRPCLSLPGNETVFWGVALASTGERGDRCERARFRVGLLEQACGDVERRAGPAEAEALEAVDAGGAQEEMLLGGLDPFGRDLHAETAAEAHHRVDDGRGIRRALDVAHEAAVDLELVERERPQIEQARITGAEIVEGE